MNELDLYIYCYDSNYTNKFKKIHLEKYKCNVHIISCYHTSYINGLITENVFYKIFNEGKYSCKMISQDIHNPNPILSIIIKPENQQYDKSFESFVTKNFHNPEYLISILEDDFYNIFDHGKVTWGSVKQNFEAKLETSSDDKFHIIENYENLINSDIPFPHVILHVDEIDTFITNFNNTKYDILVNEYHDIKKKNTNKYVEGHTNINENNVKYTCHASIGMGDFIQRFERLWKILNYSDIKYVPVKNNILSYKNPNHGQSKYLIMYDFPGFDFIKAHDRIDDNHCVNIQFQNLFEIFMYNRNYFTQFPHNKYLVINLGSYIININNRKLVGKMSNRTNDQKIIKEIKVPYTVPIWKLSWESNNKLLILHFRRGDYVDQLLSNRSNPRTMSTFNHLIENLNINESELDVVIISDHYDLSKISENNKKYIPILFDYDNIKIGDTIEANGIKLCIKDKVIGVDSLCNLNTLKYISKCNYHFGNMSCFPVIMGKIFNQTKITHICHNNPNIKNIDDLINLYNSTLR
jgi:hypothetical protein